MYADKDRQRESDRERAAAYRLRKKGVTGSVTPKKIVTPGTGRVVTPSVTPYEVRECEDAMAAIIKTFTPDIPVVIKTKRDAAVVVSHFQVTHHPTCRCFVCKPPKEGK